MNMNERIGAEMRDARKKANMTLAEVAKRMNVKSRNTISLMEKGKTQITVVELKIYCDIVGCDYKDILERVEVYDASLQGQ